MSESEALQAALKLSAESSRQDASSASPQDASQEEADLQLALLLQQEQYDAQSQMNLSNHNSRSYTSQQRRVTSTDPNSSNCNVM